MPVERENGTRGKESRLGGPGGPGRYRREMSTSGGQGGERSEVIDGKTGIKGEERERERSVSLLKEKVSDVETKRMDSRCLVLRERRTGKWTKEKSTRKKKDHDQGT